MAKWYNLFVKEQEKVEERKTDVCYSPYSDSLLFGAIYNNCTATNLSAVYRATEIISDGVATLPILVKFDGKHNGEVNHPLKDIFKNHYLFIKMLIQSVILKGNGFAFIERDRNGKVTNLRFLESEDVTINYDKAKNTLTYNCPLVSNRRIEAVNMIHLLKNSWDGVKGVSVLTYANRSLKISQNTENTAKDFFENGCNLSGVLQSAGRLTEQQKKDIRSSWANTYSNGGSGLAVLEGDFEYKPIQLSAADSQMLESRRYNTEDIARFFGVSPVLLGDLTHSSFATIEAVQLDFLLHTLQPYIQMVEDEFNSKLLMPSESKYRIEIDDKAMLRSDKQAQANYYATLLTNGILTPNEIRKELGYGECDDEGMNQHHLLYVDTSKTNINNTTNNTNNNTDN